MARQAVGLLSARDRTFLIVSGKAFFHRGSYSKNGSRSEIIRYACEFFRGGS